MRTTAARRRAERKGRRAETLAAAWLTLKGYKLLALRARTRLGELDLVARRGRVLAVVEVKARSDRASAVEAITPAAQGRIVRAASAWRAACLPYADLDIRFDAIVITPWSLPVHLISAWREDEVA